jgi:hypothetical protein
MGLSLVANLEFMRLKLKVTQNFIDAYINIHKVVLGY